MDETLGGRWLAVLDDLVSRRSSRRRISLRVSESSNYLSRVLRGRIGLRLDKLAEVLEALDVSPGAFSRLVAADESFDGAALLALFREPGETRSAALDAVEPLLAALAAGTPVERPGFARTRPTASHDASLVLEATTVLDELEARRLAEPETVETELVERLEGWTRAALASADAADVEVDAGVGGLPAAPLAAVGEALGVWAALARLSERRPQASAALSAGIRLAEASRLPRSRARVLQKAAYLLRDADQGRLALDFLLRAVDLFARAGDSHGLAKTLVDRAIVHVHLGELETAAEFYRAALEQLPAESWRNRFAAHQGLAHCLGECDQLGEAAEQLTAAAEVLERHVEADRVMAAWLEHGRGALERRRGHARTADDHYLRSMAIFEERGDLLDLALVAVDRADLLVETGRTADLSRFGREVMSWLPQLRANRAGTAALWELVRCVERGEATQALVGAVRTEIERARQLEHTRSRRSAAASS